jgi:membrane protein DedA with SNARE-associated domain
VSISVQQTIFDLLAQYGYIALYGLLALGIIGLPIPDETLMTFVGSLTVYGPLTFPGSLAVTFAGTMTGMTVSYALGKRVGKPFLYRMGKWIKLTPARLTRAELWFQKYGIWTVSFSYFIPGVRHLSCYLAGISGVPLWRYLLYAGVGAFVWCLTFLTLGRLIGNNLGVLHDFVKQHAWLAAIAAVVLIAVGVLIYLHYRRKAKA